MYIYKQTHTLKKSKGYHSLGCLCFAISKKSNLPPRKKGKAERSTQSDLFFFLGVTRKENMCPLRFILVFFSAVLAGYFAWRTVSSSPDMEDSTVEKTSVKDKQEINLKRMIQNGFWVFVDMASGRYLWRNLKEMKKDENVKSC